MGRLCQIEVENFKSYAGQQVIGPFTDFTAVIGPNGAGKSNLMDAISFVLGLNSKHLRSTSLKDLIYRPDGSAPRAPKTSVKIVYEVSDNEVEGLHDGDRLEFMRTVSRTGVSTYRINDEEVTWEDYDKQLQQIGVLVKARNFLVFQGDVESIASKSPVELSKLIEQISGSDALKAQYDELKAQCNAAEEAAIFTLKKRKVAQAERKMIKGEKEEAERFESKKQELENVQQEFMLWQIFQSLETIHSTEAEINEIRESMNEFDQREQELDQQLADVKRSHANLNKQKVEREQKLAASRKRLQQFSPDLVSLRQQMRNLDHKIQALEKSEARIQKDLAERDEKMEGLQAEMEALNEQDEALKAEENNLASSLQLNAEDEEEYLRLRAVAQSRTVTERAELQRLTKSGDTDEARLQQLEEQLQRHQAEAATYLKSLQQYQERFDALSRAIEKTAEQRDAVQQEYVAMQAQLEKFEKEQAKYDDELSGIDEKLRNARDDRRVNREQEAMNEAIDAMKRLFPGVRGRLVDLCRPVHRKFATAVTIAAGNDMDAVVVDTRVAANECVNYLKEQRIGRCTFIPLDHIRPKTIDDRLRTFGPKFRLCVDVMQCDDDIKAAVQYAVGDTIIADTLEDARQLCYERDEKVKVVTLQGAVISKAGAMTGGMSPGDARSSRWEDKEIEVLRQRKAEVEDQKTQAQRDAPTRGQLVALQNQANMLTNKYTYSQQDCELTAEKLRQIKQQHELTQQQIESVTAQIDELKAEMANREQQLAELTAEIKRIQDEVYAEFVAQSGVDVAEYEGTHLNRRAALAKQRKDLDKQRMKLQAALDYEQKRDFAKALAAVQQQIASTREQLEGLDEQERTMHAEEEELSKQIKELESKLDTLKDKALAKANELKAAQKAKASLSSERSALARKLAAQDAIIERCCNELHELLQKAQLEQITLPTMERRDSHAASDAESQDSSFPMSQLSQLSAVMQRDYTFAKSLDFSSIEHLKDLKGKDADDAKRQYEKDITNLQAELEHMQPNMRAIDKFKEVGERLKDFSDEFQAAQVQASTANQRFTEIQRQRRELFMECFEHVAEALRTIYKDLTRSSRYPMGGQAYLSLENSEEPYLGGIKYNAMPPMKRFRDMEQLSGGEKTVASLALLFAIHSFRQAPFFVLDEIDAALDNVNVKRVCNYIRQRSTDFQCIVISLKDMFYEQADALVGICRDVAGCTSRTLTLDLTHFDQQASLDLSDVSLGKRTRDMSPVQDEELELAEERSQAGSEYSSAM